MHLCRVKFYIYFMIHLNNLNFKLMHFIYFLLIQNKLVEYQRFDAL